MVRDEERIIANGTISIDGRCQEEKIETGELSILRYYLPYFIFQRMGRIGSEERGNEIAPRRIVSLRGFGYICPRMDMACDYLSGTERKEPIRDSLQ